MCVRVYTDSPEEYKLKLLKLGEAIKANPDVYIEELRVTHDSIHRTVRINGEVRKDSGEVKLGVEHEGHSGDGRAAKVRFDVSDLSGHFSSILGTR